MSRHTQTDTIRMYIDLIQQEKMKIDDSLEAIAEYSERLRAASLEAHQRLIGRS